MRALREHGSGADLPMEQRSTRRDPCRGPLRSRRAGFTMVELLVTITLAGIVFCAMVPLFVQLLKTTSTNTRRVIATNLAQARIESIRMLNWNDITQANLNSSTFAAGQFATTYTPPAGGKPYTITTTVSPSNSPSPMPSFKQVSVTVSNPTDNFTTTVTTDITTTMAVSTSVAGGPQAGNGPYSITCEFKNSSEVTKGCYIVQYKMNTSASPSPIATATVTLSPTMTPSASPTNSTVTWPSIPGGMGYLYVVWCNSTQLSSPDQTPQFHLLGNAVLKFDTNPGGT
jgi:prepilin-type N-terminal cleavage/methylation domain-containing protein